MARAHEFLPALARLHDELGRQPITWVLTGSLAFALQGLEVEVHDIDIQTNAAGAYAIERCFWPWVTRPVSLVNREHTRSRLGALRLLNVDVEIMGDMQRRRPDGGWSDPPDLARLRRTLQVAGMEIPVLPLDYEAEAYRHLGRTARAEMLQARVDAIEREG